MTPSDNPAQLRMALNLASNSILLFDCQRNAVGGIQDFRLLLANQRAEELTGQREVDMINRSASELFPHTEPLWQQARQVVDTGTSYETEVDYLLPHEHRHAWFILSLQKYGDGVAASFTDITANRQSEQRLQQTIEDLKRSNQNLEQFAYVVSHDLQEPLRKIQSFGEMLRNQSDSPISEHSAALIERMQSAASRMNTLIKDLLTFSRLSSQKQPFRSVNLQNLVADVLADLETTIRDKQAVIDVTTLPLFNGDKMQLQQAFQNLLSNALKFTKPGTIPHIRIDCEQLTGRNIVPLPGQLVVETDLKRQFYAISVVDDGIGFDEKYLNRIFTVFQRLHNRNEYPGTGIGLAIVQKVISNHQGYIGAHSIPGHGATFTLYLPANPAPPQLTI